MSFTSQQIPTLLTDWSERLGLTAVSLRLLALWFLAMTAVPIAIWIGGEQTVPITMLIAVCCQALFVAAVLGQDIGWGPTIIVFSGIALMGWGLEALGTQTGWPFGARPSKNLGEKRPL